MRKFPDCPVIPRFRYPLNRYSTAYLKEAYHRVCLSKAVWSKAKWDWEKSQPAFGYCRTMERQAYEWLKRVSIFLVEIRDVDLDYLIQMELKCEDDVNA